eukprot:2722220-Prymnesium_polylepis.1
MMLCWVMARRKCPTRLRVTWTKKMAATAATLVGTVATPMKKGMSTKHRVSKTVHRRPVCCHHRRCTGEVERVSDQE